jgi:hypothetical protein|tara:strand:- start:1054 stop:2439 length:1386 start_codon:yes stop_codon:yes gene_type:complete
MKTKNILSIFILISFMSCSKEFTDLSPISERNTGSFYTSANDFEVALAGVYNTLLSQGVYNEAIWIMNDLRSDITFWDAGGLAAAIVRYDDFEETTIDYVGRDSWIAHYKGIGRANSVIGRIEDVEMDASQKTRIVGEAKFLRSLLYYNLATTFGNVPLVLNEATSADDDKENVQVPIAQIYSQIAADLTEAESSLPSTAKGGRATKGAAAALLGKVYLTQGDKTSAASALKRVSGYSLVDNYTDLWGVENEFNKESIFEVSYESGYGVLGNLYTSAMNTELGATVTSGSRNFPTKSLISSYEAGDTRFEASIAGIGSEAVGFAADGAGWCIKYGTTNPSTDNDGPNNWVVLRYADVLLMLAEALGESTESYGYINQVRARAGLGAISSSTAGTFAEKLLQERKVELAFEGHRWPDLKRFGVAASVMSSDPRAIDIRGRLNLAIPQREMDINPDFVQNPGY